MTEMNQQTTLLNYWLLTLDRHMNNAAGLNMCGIAQPSPNPVKLTVRTKKTNRHKRILTVRER